MAGGGFLETFAKGGLQAGLASLIGGGVSGGIGIPGFSSSSSSDATATGGTNVSPWYQGDVVVAGGDARLDKTALPGEGTLGNLASSPALIAAILVFGVVAWKRLSK